MRAVAGRRWLWCGIVALVLMGGVGVRGEEAATRPSLFHDEDGEFDVSNFLSTRVGFLPIAMPITEPAVGYGLALGFSFFHDKPQAIQGGDGTPRVIMPSTTVLFGASTENGTWATGIGHLGMWNNGKIRYVGAAGYTSLNLDWFGRGDALGQHPISYTNDVLFVYQRVLFKLGESDLFLGPQYRFVGTDAQFAREVPEGGGVLAGDLESQTSGAGLVVSYDSLDQPFSPTRGVRAEVSYSQQSEALGGDFNYGRMNAFCIGYVPLGRQWVLGLRADGGVNFGDAPFYDLPGVFLRGIPRGRFVDEAALTGEAELRYDVTHRWTVVGFTGVGRVAGSVGDLWDGKGHAAVGTGFRYLIAEDYGLRMGLDVGYGEDEWTLYVTVGTGWIRP